MSYKTTVSKVWNGNAVKIKSEKIVNKSAFEIGLIVQGQAKLLAAIRYGYLAASINVQSSNNGTELESPSKYSSENKPAGHDPSTFKLIEKPDSNNEVHVGSALDYAPYVEFGTIKSNAQPFLRPALDLAKGKALTIFNNNGKMEFREYLK